MRASALLLIGATIASGAGVVIDRIAVVVNRKPIKLSDVDRDIRLTDFLNKARLTLDTASRKTAEERLIDQELIREEISSGGYRRATDADASALAEQIRRDRFAGSEVRLKEALGQYGLTEDQLRAQLLWQLTVLRFINDRFRSGVLVSDEDVQKYYEAHRANFPGALDKASAAVRTLLEGEQVTRDFESWLTEARKRVTIDYKTEAIP